MSKEQRKLKKRKARSEQVKKNLLRKKQESVQAKRQEKEDYRYKVALRKSEKSETEKKRKAIKEVRNQIQLRKKIEDAELSFKKAEHKLTESQKEQVVKNIAILKELEQEYETTSEYRNQVNAELEEKGLKTLEEKMQYLADEAREEFGEGCIDQIAESSSD